MDLGQGIRQIPDMSVRASNNVVVGEVTSKEIQKARRKALRNNAAASATTNKANSRTGDDGDSVQEVEDYKNNATTRAAGAVASELRTLPDQKAEKASTAPLKRTPEKSSQKKPSEDEEPVLPAKESTQVVRNQTSQHQGSTSALLVPKQERKSPVESDRDARRESPTKRTRVTGHPPIIQPAPRYPDRSALAPSEHPLGMPPSQSFISFPDTRLGVEPAPQPPPSFTAFAAQPAGLVYNIAPNLMSSNMLCIGMSPCLSLIQPLPPPPSYLLMGATTATAATAGWPPAGHLQAAFGGFSPAAAYAPGGHTVLLGAGHAAAFAAATAPYQISAHAAFPPQAALAALSSPFAAAAAGPAYQTYQVLYPAAGAGAAAAAAAMYPYF